MAELEQTLETAEVLLRISAVVLDQAVNPTKSVELSAADPERLIEACGTIPDIFAAACCRAMDDAPELRDEYGERVPPPLEAVASAMDEVYGFGGFRYPFSGTVDEDGIYRADDDPPLPPLARYVYPKMLPAHQQIMSVASWPLRKLFECYVYQYGITALRGISTGETRIARFD